MNMNLLSMLRYSVVIALVSSLFVISGCDEDDGPVVFGGTTLDFIQSDQFKQATSGSADNSLDSLVKYLITYPDLTAYISGTTEYTFFAPSNNAFISLTALPGLSNINAVNPDIIKAVLSYHFVEGKKLQADLTAGTELSTKFTDPAAPSAPQKIIVNSDGTLKTGSATTNIAITEADKLANNGVVHITANVLIPPSTGASLTPILGTIAASVLLGKEFTYLAYMIGYADNGVATASKVSSILANRINATTNPNGITAFAPPNAVFEGAYKAATQTTATPTATQVQGFITTAWTGGGTGTAAVTLKNHIVAGQYVVTATTGATTITNGGTITSFATKTLTTLTGTPVNAETNPFGVVITSPSTPVSQAPIVKKDLAANVGIANGILQVVAGILKPQ